MKAIVVHVERPSAEWPRDLLNVDALMRTGWTPWPLSQFILKIHSRCNLACDYCYVYRSADQGWQDQPVRMSVDTVCQTAARIAEHVRDHGLSQVEVVLHGGEPLLAGPDFISSLAATLRAAIPAEVDLYAQTNATLLDERMLPVLCEHNIRLGVSLDGDRATHDAHRVRANGRSSYSDLARGLERLRSPRYRHLFAGLLCVVDPASDPIAVYEHLLGFEPPVVDFLLPHANWSNPPAAGVGDWLVAAFDQWWSARQPETTVRLFDEIVRGVFGRPSRVESIGLSPARLVVVETDGSIEQSDALKSTYDGAARTGLHIGRDPFDAVLRLPQVVARQIGAAALSDRCRRCDLRGVCGGGFYPHRYREGEGFLNPSVYCEDLTKLILHAYQRVEDNLSAAWSQASR